MAYDSEAHHVHMLQLRLLHRIRMASLRFEHQARIHKFSLEHETRMQKHARDMKMLLEMDKRLTALEASLPPVR